MKVFGHQSNFSSNSLGRGHAAFKTKGREKPDRKKMSIVTQTTARFYTIRNIRVRSRFFDEVGHQTTNASIGNKYFFTK